MWRSHRDRRPLGASAIRGFAALPETTTRRDEWIFERSSPGCSPASSLAAPVTSAYSPLPNNALTRSSHPVAGYRLGKCLFLAS